MNRFLSEPGYKTIQRIRSECVRPAFDDLRGDAYSGFGFGPEHGPVLKAGSGRQEDDGYFKDFQSFWQLLQNYGVIARGSAILPSTIAQPVVTGTMMRRFTDADIALVDDNVAANDSTGISDLVDP